MTARVAVDIGGTFTDATLIDEATGHVAIAKTLTTPANPSEGFMAAVERALREAGVTARDVTFVVHATTVATNAIIEGKVARSGFVTTEGFRDLLEIGRQVRPTLYDPQFEKPRPLVPRDRAVGVVERLGPKGEVLTPLDERSVRDAAALLARERVESVAVCLLHAYVNPEHERRVGEILAEELPGVPVSLSSEVAPEFREYLRASTTVINAVVRPVVGRYLERIERRLAEAGIGAKLLVMQSSGGVFGADAAARRPVFMVESGPAAGVIAAAHLGAGIGRPDILSFDMGGTTAKVGLIRDGRPSVTKDYQVGAHAGAGIGGMSLAGYPVRTPVVDLVEIGAGGGSIAWVDSGGLLRVGPRSAGADPGPACYGRGGEDATVTDASLLLGYLDPAGFAGGTMALDVRAAEAAIHRLAAPLGLDPVRTAAGIHRVVNARMADQIRLMTIQRGHDPREFTLVLLGGAGPVHGVALAEELALPDVLVPEAPGVLSALGLLAAAIEHQHARTLPGPVAEADLAAVNACLRELDAAGRARMADEAVPPEAVRVTYTAEMRYVGQAYELPVPIGAPVGAQDLAAVQAAFHASHERIYGYARPGQAVEFVNFRAVHAYPLPRPALAPAARPGGSVADARRGERRAYFAPHGFLPTPVYVRGRLPAGGRVTGPAILEQPDTTTVIPPGWAGTVEESGNLRLGRVSR